MKSVVHRIPITRARINLGQVVRRAHLHREVFILEKGGIPVAGIMSMEDMDDYLELRDPALKKQIQQGYRDYLRGKARDVDALLMDLRRRRPKSKK